MTSSIVYFVEADGLELVKIGATQDLVQRLTTLTSENACELRLLGVIPRRDAAAYANELKTRFAALRAHDDWFRLRAPLRAFLDRTLPSTKAQKPIEPDMHGFMFDAPAAPLLDVHDVAAYLDVSVVTVRRLVRNRQLGCVRVGRQLRFDLRDPSIVARRRAVDLRRSA